ncbi:MAG: ATP-dependent helicase [Anaerolineae bacterium]|nr:ATP-dependent helicase [Anaerolineae bacterium]
MQPTEEQLAIIHHPLGQHARVLAVAGSGKTTTMVYRIKHLVEDLHQDPARIRVVMFNRLARGQFEQKLDKEIFELGKRPKVLTFHALAFSLRANAEKLGLLPQYKQLWIGDREELAIVCARRAIEGLIREDQLMDDVDPEAALDAIGLWKASLIPPEHAGHRTHPDLALVYRRFEELREEARALTFDDFVPKAMMLLRDNAGFRQRFANRLDHLIVDEYQDINYGQQQLIRLLAGDRADVMVVGDDDQTIYEWRAARPHYILKGFQEDFANKPVVDYTLSRSFRFGPLIAQAAYNVVTFNQQRAAKPLVAHDAVKMTGITILTDESEQATSIALGMAQEIDSLMRKHQVSPQEIVVLGRTFIQLCGSQVTFIEQKIPFRVLGQGPFFERDENRTLVDYIRLALAWNKPAAVLKAWRLPATGDVGETSAQERGASYYRRVALGKGPYAEAVRTVLAVANTPSRKLARTVLQKAVENGGKQGITLGESLEALLDVQESPLSEERRESLEELVDFVHRIAERCEKEPDWKAGDALQWLEKSLDYCQHFTGYYGEGSASESRIGSVSAFIDFAGRVGKPILAFIEYLGKLDSTLGLPPEKVITMTTVHRTKGLEYDYVFIPDCTEGNMPVHIADDTAIYDRSGTVPEHPSSPPLESERRLFYVAVTRAKKHLYIGTIIPPQRGQQMQSTTPLPCRFLEEMRLPPTEALVGATQKLLQTGIAEKLNTAIQEWQAHKTIITYLIQHYITPEVGARLLQSLTTVAESPFQYICTYPGLETIVRKRSEPEPPAVTGWGIWESIR